MSKSIATIIGRTASLVKDYTAETRQGNNGEYLSQSICYNVAVDRDYKTTRIENGKQITENPTDFHFVRFTGAAAKAMKDYASAKNAEGKLVSRLIACTGSFETYMKDREVAYETVVNIGGQGYKVTGTTVVKEKNYVFVCDSVSFLDSSNKAQAPAQAGTTTVSSVMPIDPAQAAAAAQAVPTAPVAPIAVQAAPAVAQAPAVDNAVNAMLANIPTVQGGNAAVAPY